MIDKARRKALALMDSDLNVAPVVAIAIDIPQPYPGNPKKHDEDHINKLAALIEASGQTDAILLDKNMVVIAGHGRLLACKKLKRSTINARIMSHYTEEEARLTRISHNRSVSNDYYADLERMEIISFDLKKYEAMDFGFDDDAEFEKLTMIYDEIDTTAFTDNLIGDVDAQIIKAVDDINKADKKMVRLSIAMGFKAVTTETTRDIARFMAKIQERFNEPDIAAAFSRFVAEETAS